MLRSNQTKISFLTLFSCCLLAFGPALPAQDNQKIVWVAHYKADCVGVGPQKCYLIKDNMYDPWKLWYDEIERLDWEEGFAYEVVVAEEQVPDAPADASSIRLRVVELLTMINANSPSTALPPELADLPPQGQALGATEVVTEEVVAEEVVMVQEETVEVETDPETVETEPLQTTVVASEVQVAVEPSDPPPAATPPPTQPLTASEPLAPTLTPTPIVTPAPKAQSTPPPAPTPTPVAEPAPIADPDAPSTTVSTQPEETLQSYRGHLTIGVGLETRSFKICGAEAGVWIEDKSDDDLWRTYRELSGYPNRSVFMVVHGALGPSPSSGFGAHYDQQLTVTDLREAATEGPGCSEAVGDIDFVAFGNEPFWRVEISPGGIVYSEAGGAEIWFPYKEPFASQTKRVYWGASDDGSAHKIQVSIEERQCRDTMADAQYSFTATIMINDRELSGCARIGSP